MWLKSVFIGEISDHDILGVWSFEKKKPLIVFLLPSPSLMIGFVSSAIYVTEDGYVLALLSESWPQTHSGTLSFRDLPPFSAKWIFRKGVLLWFLMGSPFWAKQNMSVGQYRMMVVNSLLFSCQAFVGINLITQACVWAGANLGRYSV